MEVGSSENGLVHDLCAVEQRAVGEILYDLGRIVVCVGSSQDPRPAGVNRTRAHIEDMPRGVASAIPVR